MLHRLLVRTLSQAGFAPPFKDPWESGYAQQRLKEDAAADHSDDESSTSDRMTFDHQSNDEPDGRSQLSIHDFFRRRSY